MDENDPWYPSWSCKPVFFFFDRDPCGQAVKPRRGCDRLRGSMAILVAQEDHGQWDAVDGWCYDLNAASSCGMWKW